YKFEFTRPLIFARLCSSPRESREALILPSNTLTDYFNRFSGAMEKRCMDMWRQLDAARTPEERACGIPVMDMGLYQKDPQAWSICFVAGFPVHGFAILKNHGIPAAQVEAACDAVRALFARPWEELEEKYIVDPSRLRE